VQPVSVSSGIVQTTYLKALRLHQLIARELVAEQRDHGGGGPAGKIDGRPMLKGDDFGNAIAVNVAGQNRSISESAVGCRRGGSPSTSGGHDLDLPAGYSPQGQQ
jgi:hypothetical protein